MATEPAKAAEKPSKARGLITGLGLLAAAGLAFGLLAGFFGDRHPLFDTAAHFRAHAALGLVFAAMLLVWGRLFAAALASLFAAVLGLATVIPYLLPLPAPAPQDPNAPRYTVLQMNLRFDTRDKEGTLRLIGELSPDVVTVQEMTGPWQTALESLSGRYPYQFYCAPPDFWGDVAIISRRPFAEGDEGVCDVSAGFAAKRIDFDGTEVVVGSQHLRWPFPGRQWRQIGELLPTLGALQDPLVIAGDFNAAPWSASLRTYARASDTRIAEGIGPTWILRGLPSWLGRLVGLPIDNVLVSKGVELFSVVRPPATESDHLPVLATFTLPFARSQEPRIQTVERFSPSAPSN